jgi:methionyl-tRNA synthetase
MISYDDFAKLDIRIGTIKTVEVIEGADKLLKLVVDVGETNEAGEATYRQIVSGIRTYFEDPQVLVGKQCPFLVNLEPRVIRDFESQGMILAASTTEGEFALLHPSAELPQGSKIK